MTELREIHTLIPLECVNQPVRIPAQSVLDAYFASIDAAYEQTGLSVGDTEAYPGLPDGHEEGIFQVKSFSGIRQEDRQTHLLASSHDRQNILQAEIDWFDRLVLGYVDIKFTSKQPEWDTVRHFGITRASWPKITNYIMEKAEAGVFVPVERLPLIN